MKPMLLERKNPDIYSLEYPYYGVPKLDGIRCIITRDGPKTRTLKDIPNKFIRRELNSMGLIGLDGELIVGSPTDPEVFNKTTSAVRRVDGEPDFRYYVFDCWDTPTKVYDVRSAELQYLTHNLHPRVEWLKIQRLGNVEELAAYEEQCLDAGYEGIILRNPKGLYKYGRTTMKEGNSYKLKRFVDGEAYVVGMEPKYHNTNEEFTNELGRTARSKKAEGLVAMETMGALAVEDCESQIQFSVGSGFNDEQRLWWYNNWKAIAETRQKVVYKKFLVGEKNKPRHPIFKGLRMEEDV